MKKALFILATITLLLSACKKETTTTPPPTPQTQEQKITGSWNGDEADVEMKIPGFIDTSFVQDMSFMTIEFKADGTYNMDSAGVALDNGNWEVPAEDKFKLDDENFDIFLLNSTNFNFGIDSTALGGLVVIKQTIKLKK